MLKKIIQILEKIDLKISSIKIFRSKRKENIQSGDIQTVRNSYLSFFIKVMIVIFTLFVLGAISIIAVLIFLFTYYATDLPSVEDKQIIEQSTKIYDRKNNLLYEIHGDVDRTWVDFENISPYVEKATLALEDQNFYSHPGFDWKGLTRVVFTQGYNLVRKVIPSLPWKQTVGGSTITQQLVKNTILSSEKTVKRKVQELLLARNIEEKYSKKEILELYLNYIPYGGSTYGIEAAAQKFFGISSTSLTLAQSATLSALPQSPTFLSPYGNNVKTLLDRKDKALNQMYSIGLIEKLELEAALKETIEFIPFIEEIKHPHFVLYAKEELQKLLTEKYGEEEGLYLIENGGLSVITTLDPDIQAIAESSVTNGINSTSNYNVTNASIVAQNPKNGQILAMVGSVNFFDQKQDGQVNVALSERQPGSSIKPIIYTQAFIEGYAPGTVVYDVQTDFGNNYKPNNYDLKFVGPISFRNALGQSRNVPAVKALFLAGVDDSIDLARRMGITTWRDDASKRCGLSLVLGGCEVRLIDMVQAYSVLNNLGVKYKQSSLLEVKKPDGEILFKWEQPKDEKVIDEGIAYQVVDVMSDRQARLAIFGSSLDVPRKTAVKTGTTNSYLDAWTIGFVPQITVGVWAGNNQPSPMKHGGSLITGPIWKNTMNQIFKLDDYLSIESWKQPSSIKRVKISTLTGKLPSELTPEDKIEEEIFTSQNIPTETEPEDMYKTAEICDPTGLLANEYCPDYLRTTLVYTFHHSIRPDLPNWENPVQEWAKKNAEKMNEEGSTEGFPVPSTSIEGQVAKKIKYITSIEEIPTEYDDTFDSDSVEGSPKITWESTKPLFLSTGTNIINVNISSDNNLDRINVLLGKTSVFEKKFLENTDSLSISIFVDEEEYPLGSTQELKIFLIDENQLRSILSSSVTIKDDIEPPIITDFMPKDQASISSGKSFDITAEITDNKDKISKVEFYLDGAPLTILYEAPYTYTVNLEDIEGGNHVIAIRAFDASGNMTKESHEITVR